MTSQSNNLIYGGMVPLENSAPLTSPPVQGVDDDGVADQYYSLRHDAETDDLKNPERLQSTEFTIIVIFSSVTGLRFVLNISGITLQYSYDFSSPFQNFCLKRVQRTNVVNPILTTGVFQYDKNSSLQRSL